MGIFLFTLLFSLSGKAACSHFRDNIDCFDLSFPLQRKIVFAQKERWKDLSGTRFAKIRWVKLPALEKCRHCDFREVFIRPMIQDFSGMDLSHSKFIGVEADHVQLEGSRLVEADFRGAKLSGSILRNADLRGANFEAADLSRADLRGARLEGASFQDALLLGTKFSKGVAPTKVEKK